MNDDAISTAAANSGTPEGLKNELRSGLSKKQRRECNKALYKGVKVMAEGMHPRGVFDGSGVSVFMRPSWHTDVITAGQRLTDTLLTFQTKKWRTRIGEGNIKIIPFSGETQIDSARYVEQVIKWEGFLEDLDGKMEDLREKEAGATRRFLEKHVFPRWQIDPKQTDLPVFDELDYAEQAGMCEMLANMSTAIDERFDNFLPFHAWLESRGDSKSPYVLGVGTSLGTKVEPEESEP